jgi:hypothetical protein
MIRKQFVKTGQRVKVTFVLPADTDAPVASVVGDFNDWDPAASPLRRRSPTRSVTVSLAPAGATPSGAST